MTEVLTEPKRENDGGALSPSLEAEDAAQKARRLAIEAIASLSHDTLTEEQTIIAHQFLGIGTPAQTIDRIASGLNQTPGEIIWTLNRVSRKLFELAQDESVTDPSILSFIENLTEQETQPPEIIEDDDGSSGNLDEDLLEEVRRIKKRKTARRAANATIFATYAKYVPPNIEVHMFRQTEEWGPEPPELWMPNSDEALEEQGIEF